MIGANGLRGDLDQAPIPVGPQTVAAILDGRDGSAPALIDAGGMLTYADLEDTVRAATSALHALGLNRGDRIAASCFNHSAMIVAFLAAQRLGLIWVGVNRVLATAEKCAQLADCGARLLLADPHAAEALAAERHRVPTLERILTSGVDPATEWPMLIAAHSGREADCPPADRLAPAAISYTSGTTGLPKGAVHSQHGIMTFVNGGFAAARGGIWQPGLRRSVTVALTILNGMTFGPLAALASDGCFVSMDRSDAAGVAEWIERTGIEILCCTPPTIRDLLTRPDLQRYDLVSLRYAMAGGAAGAGELREGFRARFGSELVDEYGLTEAPSGVAGSRTDRLPVAGTVGQVYPHLDVAALDSDANPLPPGQVGEIGVRAARDGAWAGVFTGMLGYWNQPGETAKALRGGWLCTGDLGAVDAHGHLAIVGRLKELIIRGGANIYPVEVERVLRVVDGIEDAVVIGMPDERLGEIVCAFVKLTDPAIEAEPGLADRLAAACAGQIARYKVPERWLVVDDIPRNAMNKPNRALLREGPRRPLHRLSDNEGRR